MKNYKKTYITWFLIVLLPAILIKLATYSGEMTLSESLAGWLTVISKIIIIIITVWYGLKTGSRSVNAWILGLSTLLPFMTWVSLIILLSRKSEESRKSKQNTKPSELSHTNIKSKPGKK